MYSAEPKPRIEKKIKKITNAEEFVLRALKSSDVEKNVQNIQSYILSAFGRKFTQRAILQLLRDFELNGFVKTKKENRGLWKITPAGEKLF